MGGGSRHKEDKREGGNAGTVETKTQSDAIV
jgi:hypothetical protein